MASKAGKSAPVKADPVKPVAAKAPQTNVSATDPAPHKAAAVTPPAVKPAPKAAAPIIQAAETATSTAALVAASTAQKDDTMATNFDMPKADAPKMFADMNDRAKAAMEKGSKMFEEMNDFTKGNVEALVESGKIAARGFEMLGQDAADYGRRSFEGMTATMKTMASIKSPTELFKLQSDYMRTAFDAAVAQGSKSTETMIKLAGDAAQPISNRFAVAADKVKATA